MNIKEFMAEYQGEKVTCLTFHVQGRCSTNEESDAIDRTLRNVVTTFDQKYPSCRFFRKMWAQDVLLLPGLEPGVCVETSATLLPSNVDAAVFQLEGDASSRVEQWDEINSGLSMIEYRREYPNA